MRCIVCGKEEIFMDYLCREDYLKKNPLFTKVPKKLKCNQCRETGVFFKEQIKETSIKECIRKMLQKELVYDKRRFDLKKIELDVTHEVKATLRGTINEKRVAFPFTFDLTIKESVDPALSAKHDNYFEGMLQVRWQERLAKEKKEIAAFIGKFVVQNRANIANVAYLKNGMDFLLSSNQVVKECAYAVKKQYGGEVKINAKLFSRDHQTSKELYRVTALVRLPEFTIGDIMQTKKRTLLITSIQGHEVSGRDLLTQNKTTALYLGEEYTIVPQEEIKPSTVSIVEPRLEVVDPWDYQSKPVINPKPCKPGQKVRVAYIGKKLLLVS